ncbi:MAG: NnrS family protein [Lautropia sp.]|nr:NnrS family protein [Lautropia sp.]
MLNAPPPDRAGNGASSPNTPHRGTAQPGKARSAPPAKTPAGWLDVAHPLWLCGFRPFFAVAILSAPGLLALWLLFLGAGWPLPQVPGGPIVWHAHELVMGFGLAAVAGFALTAVPEFTSTPSFDAAAARRLLALWLLGRISFWLTGWWPTAALLVSGLAHAGLMLYLTVLIAPRLWHDPGFRQQGFLWSSVALIATACGFYVDALRGEMPLRWLHATLGVLMALIVVAMSRISMAIVNTSLDESRARDQAEALTAATAQASASLAAGNDANASTQSLPATPANPPLPRDDDDRITTYLARPPRRHLAVFCISLFTALHWWLPDSRVTGWVALAASAAMLNLLNDWHVGRALFHRWPLMLYGVYVFMALGYGAIGLALLSGNAGISPGMHLLTTGALGLAVYAVICIAGYTHSGQDKDGRPWVIVGAVLIVLSALARAGAWWGDATLLLNLAGLLWCAAFILQGVKMLPVFFSPRTDGAAGCAGVQEEALDEDGTPSSIERC